VWKLEGVRGCAKELELLGDGVGFLLKGALALNVGVGVTASDIFGFET
jgi:hypothetical protein